MIIPKQPEPQLKLLAACQMANMQIPLLGNRLLSIDCEPGAVDPPHFEVQFYPGQFQPEELDLAGHCIISFKADQLIHVIHAEITEVVSDHRFTLTAIHSYTNTQQREYYRVDTDIHVQYQRIAAPAQRTANPGNPEKLQVNLSGGGVRFPAADQFKLKERLKLHLFLDGFQTGAVECMGQIVRIADDRHGEQQICLNFVGISQIDRDRIISYCFAKQRELLRKRIKIKTEI